MDTTVKESVELMVELICAFSVMAMLSLAMYTDVISRLLERLFYGKCSQNQRTRLGYDSDHYGRFFRIRRMEPECKDLYGTGK